MDLIKQTKELKHRAYTVNLVNLVGVMGAGLAKQFKVAFPSHFQWYKDTLYKTTWKMGRCKIDHANNIIAFPTKRHWNQKSDLQDIVNAAVDLSLAAIQYNMRVIYTALPGTGLGGLDKSKVYQILKEAFKGSNTQVIIVGSGKYNGTL